MSDKTEKDAAPCPKTAVPGAFLLDIFVIGVTMQMVKKFELFRRGGGAVEEAFQKVYRRFRLYFYQNVFEQFRRQHGRITLTEAFDAGAIHALGRPTMGEFAAFVGASRPGATYRVGSLVEKGFVQKLPSSTDRRESILAVTDRFLEVGAAGDEYVHTVIGRMMERFSAEELSRLSRMRHIIADELMGEVDGAAARLRPLKKKEDL